MEIKRVFDLLDNYVETYPNQEVALAGKKDGKWVKYSSHSYKENADILSYALIELGIEKGDKVKVTLRFRGREMAHISSNAHVLDDFASLLEDVAQITKAAKLEGRNMSMFLEKKR